eukprot:CAMPEP_0184482160 /NCGR_PEP_ID=MMETSP0113_2-20130426/3738_1 /TAXON_ID=91329 /ORGANISM="Norrisiella sphaerica, Strain BC52" /LENGTH=310 /DNA_ID=CAMNT_0026861745 /DNA_START=136 /DNA_END=1068 /DNA_ORIENTATION=-
MLACAHLYFEGLDNLEDVWGGEEFEHVQTGQLVDTEGRLEPPRPQGSDVRDFCEVPARQFGRGEDLKSSVFDACCANPNVSEGDNLQSAGTNLTFIAIPKAGSTTVADLMKVDKLHHMAKDRMDDLRRPGQFAFAVVRSPFSRMLSWFKFCICKDPVPFPRALCRYAFRMSEENLHDQPLAFRKWLKVAVDYPNYWVETPMVDWIKDENGKVIIDYVVRNEHIVEDLSKLSCMIKRPLNKVERHNPSKCNRRTYTIRGNQHNGSDTDIMEAVRQLNFLNLTQCYDSESVKIVAAKFRKDLDYFGYSEPKA